MPHRTQSPQDKRRIEERQQMEVSGESETYVMTRAADHSLWGKSSAFIERYRLLWTILFGIMLALGFDFKTPAQFYKEVNDRVDVLSKNARNADAARDSLSRKLDILITFRCLDQTNREMAIAGVDCSHYINSTLTRPK